MSAQEIYGSDGNMDKKKYRKAVQKEAVRIIEEDVTPPAHSIWLLAGVLGVTFFFNFIVYLLTLAPTVTFEDSGELITAAFNLGVAHSPGYPLFTLLGRIFTFLPFGTIAFRVNLMSAFFTAAAGVFVCWATILLIENTFMRSQFFNKISSRSIELLTFSLGICSAILYGTAKTTWEQAIIAEVYGINSFLVAVFLFLTFWFVRLPEFSEKKRVLFLLSYICGLALTNHTTSLMLIPLLGLYIWIFERKLLYDRIVLLKSLLCFILGLTPYIYLPVASSKNPIIDWGNPETFTNFIRVISRHQYDIGTKQTFESFSAQIAFFSSDLLLRQWFPFVLLFAVAGLLFLFQKNRPAFYFVLALLFFTMPLTAWMTNFDISNPVAAIENKPLVSVFYIPAYLITAILIGIGLFRLSAFLTMGKQFVAVLIGFCLPLAAGGFAIVRTMPEVSMHNYYFARDYCDNVFSSMPENALYIVNWDPFYFPTMYYQYVEKKRPDLIILDETLLIRSWYINWLQNYYPEFTRQAGREVQAFLKAVEPFEKGARFNAVGIEHIYNRMVNALIDSKLKANKNVYFSYASDSVIMRSNHLEPQFAAYKYTQQPIDTTITDTGLSFSSFIDSTIRKDRMAKYMQYYYGNLFAMRGLQIEAAGDSTKAYYCFQKALPFFDRNTKQALFIEKKLSRDCMIGR